MSQSFSDRARLEATTGKRLPSDASILTLLEFMGLPSSASSCSNLVARRIRQLKSVKRSRQGHVLDAKQARSTFVVRSGEMFVAGALGLRISSCPWLT